MNYLKSMKWATFITAAWFFTKFVGFAFLLVVLPDWFFKANGYKFSVIITYFLAGYAAHQRFRHEIHVLNLMNFKKEYIKSAYMWMYFSSVLISFSHHGKFSFLPFFLAIISGTFILYKEVIDNEKGEPIEKEEHLPQVIPGVKYTNSVFPTSDYLDAPPYVSSHGSAWWLSDTKKENLTDRQNDKPGYRGLWLGGGFFHHNVGNLITVAPPGSGKGAALIIPNLLWERKYRHSFVVFDPKGTNACITARFQKESQGKKVVIIDPMGLQKLNNATHGIPSADFNPLDHIHGDLFNGTAQIANLLIPDDPNGEKFWNQGARSFLQSVLLHIMTSEKYAEKRNLIELYKLMVAGDLISLFEEMSKNHSVDGIISDSAENFTNMLEQSEKTFSSIRSVVNFSLQWLSNSALQNCMKKSSFRPEELEEGNVALYLCQPIHNKEGFASFSRLVVGFCLRANSRPSSKPKAWVYYLLDEFPTMGVFPEVVESLAYSREYRMRIWLFAQSLSQIDTIYKTERRNEICGNIGVFQVFNASDYITQEYASKKVGNKTQMSKSSSENLGSQQGSTTSFGSVGSHNSGTSKGISSTYSYHTMPLISPEAVQYEPHIITLTDWAGGPMRLFKWQYWQSDPFNSIYSKYFNDGRADKNPNISVIDEDEAL